MSDNQAVLDIQLASQDRAVSPVVGVVLMIVLAVSLTVVVGGFTSDLIDQAQVDTAPQASFSMYNDGSVEGIRVAHDGGDEISVDDLNVVVRQSSGGELSSETYFEGETPETIQPGETFIVNGSSLSDGEEYTVLVFDEASGNVIDDGVVQYQE